MAISNLLGISTLELNSQNLVKKYFTFEMLIFLIDFLPMIFFILYLTDLVGYSFIGVLYSVSAITQTLTDYPSGVLGDWLKYKYVLFIGYFLFGLSTLCIVFFPDKIVLIFAFVVRGFSFAQISGALQSWFENEYNTIVVEDTENTVFSIFSGILYKYLDYMAAVTYLIGGFLATYLSNGRSVILAFSGITSIVLSILFLLFLNQQSSANKIEENYISRFKKGFGVIKSSKFIFYLVLSNLFQSIIQSLWFTLLAFPVLFGYTGSDFNNAVSRVLILIVSGKLSEIAGKRVPLLDWRKWIVKTTSITTVIFYLTFCIITFFFPITNTLELIPISIIFLLYVISNYYRAIKNIITQKIYLKIIPNEARNSFYSIQPTLITLLLIPGFFYFSKIIELSSFYLSIFILSISSVIPVLLLKFAVKSNLEVILDNQIKT
ncbi:MAG: hypothetical protein OEY49_11110 [Candidatus Heimdallarchaeota archaeon]|nr:hypothetical protein [Candidatus Heimdallarchaeota archaeon]